MAEAEAGDSSDLEKLEFQVEVLENGETVKQFVNVGDTIVLASGAHRGKRFKITVAYSTPPQYTLGGFVEQSDVQTEVAALSFREKVLEETTGDDGGEITGFHPEVCEGDDFQGLRFYDGTSFGYLRVHPDSAELLVGGESLTFPIDGTKEHTYRLVGKGRDISLYIDGQLAIDGSGKLVGKTNEKVIEFGDIGGRQQSVSSEWSTFKYSVTGAFPPNSTSDLILDDVGAFPQASVGRLKEYSDRLYVSVEPDDEDKSSSIYSYREGFEPEPRSVLAITKSSITAVAVDPNRDSNIFGTSGKFLGTDRGLQYILGGKPFPFDVLTSMSTLPSENGWQIDSNCEEDCYSLAGNTLTIDTTAEVGARYLKFMQAQRSDAWVANASNSRGWTVEARVKVVNDGTNGSIDAVAAAAAAAEACDDCGKCENADDGLRAPGVFINDGTYQEFVQFFQRGVRLRNAKIFAPQNLSDQFYTVRIIGKGTAVAVYAKGDSDKAFKRLIFAPNGLSVKAVPSDRQECPSVAVDQFGTTHAVWQDAPSGEFAIYYSKLVGRLIERGSSMMGSRTIDVDATIINARIGFNLPPAGSGIDYKKLPPNVVIAPAASFKSKGVKPGDLLYIYGDSIPTRSYVVLDVMDEILLKLDTSDDLGGLLSSEWAVVSSEQTWLPPSRVSANSFDSTDARIVVHSSGDVYVVYANQEHGSSDIYVRRGRSEPFGIKWAETVRVTNSSKSSVNPDMVELPSGDLLLVWEDSSSDSTGSLIYSAVVSVGTFGAAGGYSSAPIRTGNFFYKRPRIARSGERIVVVYEDQGGGKTSVRCSDGTYSGSASQPVEFLAHIKISDSTGHARRPSVCSSPDGSFCVAWQDFASGRSQVVASTSSIAGTWAPPFRVSSSRGSSLEPEVSADGAGNIYVVFADDRTRNKYYELYVAKYDKGANQWLSSAQNGLDTKIKTYLTDNRRPAISVASDGRVSLAWETYKDGSRTVIAGATFDGKSVTIDRSVVAFFPLDDNESSLDVKNAVRSYSEAGAVEPQLGGTAFQDTASYSVPSSTPSASLYSSDTQRSFSLNNDGDGFVVPMSLFEETGAVDIRLTPRWYSTAPGPFVFFGNASLETTTPNTISCGVGTYGGGNKLKLRIVDSLGVVHETAADHNNFAWSENQTIALRAVWDSKAIGVSSLTGISFPEASVGYACACSGAIFKTTDNGMTWSRVLTGTTYDLYSIDFVSATTGWACGEMGTILKTTDGTNWTVVDTGLDVDLNGIYFIDSLIGFAVGAGGTVLSTTDGGNSWTEEDSGTEGDLNDVFAVDAATLVVVGMGGRVLLSSDGGSTFDSVDAGTTEDLLSISRSHGATDPEVLYVSGRRGTLLKSEDGGATWEDVSPDWPVSYSYVPTIHCVSRGTLSSVVWGVGQGGAIIRSDDGGATWAFFSADTDDGALRAIDAFFDGATSDETAVAGGIGGLVVRLSDSGATQTLSYTKSGNLTLYVDGQELIQVRTNDAPFEWENSADVVFGDYQESGSDTANAIFDEVVIYKAPPPRESAHKRHEIQTYQAIAVTVVGADSGKKIEWGAIPWEVKSKTLWKEFKMYFCGAKEPLLHFAWDAGIGLADDVVRDFAFDSSGGLWIATENGVSRMDSAAANECVNAWLSGSPVPDREIFNNFTNIAHDLAIDSINSITVDSGNNVWAGTDKGVMGMLAEEDSTFSTEGGDPAFPTVGDGEVVNDPSSARKFTVFLTVENGLPSNRVLVVRALGSILFVGTDNGLAVVDLSKLSSGESTETEVETETETETAEVATEAEEATESESDLPVVVINTGNGLPSNLVKTIAFEGSVAWIGTDKGAIAFNPGCNELGSSAAALRNADVYSITIDEEGRKFFGTRTGLVKLDGVDVKIFPPSSGIGHGIAVGGAFDAAGSLWLASASGLIEFDERCNKFTSYGIQDGIIGDKNIVDYERFRILGAEIPNGGCEKALVTVFINGKQLSGGFTVNPWVPAIVLDSPTLPSDKVEVFVHQGWRKVRDFAADERDDNPVLLETEATSFKLYRKRFAAGSVVLGGNASSGARGSNQMYVVFAKPIIGTADPISAVFASNEATLTSNVAEGESVYTDSDEPIEVIPTDLVGSQMISFPAEDSQELTDEFVEFTLSADAVVYVAYDSRAAAIPAWLRPFEQMRAVLRVSDMEVFTDGSGQEKLFVATSGTTGCVYDILRDESTCDIAAQIAMDASAPSGCATISKVNATDSVTLKLQATDSVTGVADMQISSRADFTTDGTTPVPFQPFASSYTLSIDASGQEEEPVDDFDSEGEAVLFFENGNDLLVGTKNPGLVYKLNKSTRQLELLFDTGEDEVLSIAKFGSLLIVGTGVNGRVFQWNGTTLSQISLPAGDVGFEQATSLAVFDNRLFIGTSPSGRIYQVDDTLTMTLFKDTNETKITSMAVLGGRMFWSTLNDAVEENDVLNTTTEKGHRHTIVVQAGATRLEQVSGTTSSADGHTHAIVNGVVQAANGHTHALNGDRSGKVFAYSLADDHTVIVHADRDHEVSALASTKGSSPLLFAGTSPNGKILRYVEEEGIFIKSFDTTADKVSALRSVGDKMFAAAGDKMFYFDGTRWQFSGGSDDVVLDFAQDGTNVFVLKAGEITSTQPQSLSDEREICAFVRFRDAAGNVSSLYDENGKAVACYNPCVKLKDVVDGDDEDAPTVAHRVVEVDDDAKVVFGLSGPLPFYGGNRVEEEVGVYESEVFNGTNSLVQWSSISWEALVPTGSSLTIAVRSSTTSAGIKDAEWSKELTNPTGNDLTNLVGQFMQFRATLKVSQAGAASPELHRVDIELRTSQAVHYFTTNFALPDDLKRGILTYNGCINPPVTDVVFGVSGLDTTNFSDYMIIEPNKVFELPAQHQTKNLRVGIKLISSPGAVPKVDEFALLFSLANDAFVKLNKAGMPTGGGGQIAIPGSSRTVLTEQVQGHVHTITFDSAITDKTAINGRTSINAGHSHAIVNGIVQPAAGHTHQFEI
jgi:photosystem II stability/assembly factor-like uncharacterized protein